MPNKTQQKLAYSTGSQPDDNKLETRDILSNHKFALQLLSWFSTINGQTFYRKGKVNCPT